jgi:hypothetical protein
LVPEVQVRTGWRDQRQRSRRTLIVGGVVQTVFTLALLGMGDDRSSVWLLLAGTFAGGVGNMLVIVGFMVTATSGLDDHEQGPATGLATRTRQIGSTMGTPPRSCSSAPLPAPCSYVSRPGEVETVQVTATVARSGRCGSAST